MLKDKISKSVIILSFSIFIFFVILNADNAFAKKLKVMTTSTDLKSITEYIGGDKVEVESIAKGYANPHHVDPKPSFMVKLGKADLFIRIGLDLELWAQLLIDGARNPRIRFGTPGHVITAVGVDLQGMAVHGEAMIDRSLGDVHIYGNPHFWLDPLNGKIMAQNILEGLKTNSPENARYFENNKRLFDSEIDTRLAKWLKRIKPYSGTKVIAYHRSWPNFSKRFGINVVDYVEPKPGIAPSPAHIAALIKRMKSEDIRVLIREPCYETKIPKFISTKTGASVLTLPVSVEGVSEVKDYFELFDYIIENLVSTFEKQEIASHD
ncbi:MAG: metal ABC transporter substrate-binding protein [Candidatus Scalindua rubra]|uniref:Periplasmic zinc binding protein n=1 Tax=Candidatus Scalindua brodae TaxID=237368 RepID=A0A0B0EGA9_9BACT|nr:MAG: periplasmic zinc binding protein [Candidatus Scalindua brodae]MBZ0110655.1 metal ABC transporter substrate-binding protein [Candidatus Scalindua rubra]TWU28924.1 Manganese ABC transporter substrate-binding lipoprotein precursor [Candidatus Brocadiaceae bacterium S225]